MILIFSEDDETLLEILGKGREIADSMKTELGAISLGNEENLIASGADKIYSIDIASSSDHIVEVISNLNDQFKPEIILIGGTKLGKEVAPRIAQRSGVGCATDCIDCSIADGHLIVKRYMLGGRFLETIRFLRKPQIATLLPGRFEKKAGEAPNRSRAAGHLMTTVLL